MFTMGTSCVSQQNIPLLLPPSCMLQGLPYEGRLGPSVVVGWLYGQSGRLDRPPIQLVARLFLCGGCQLLVGKAEPGGA